MATVHPADPSNDVDAGISQDDVDEEGTAMTDHIRRIALAAVIRGAAALCAAYVGMIGFVYMIADLMQYNVSVARGEGRSDIGWLVVFEAIGLLLLAVGSFEVVLRRIAKVYSYIFLVFYSLVQIIVQREEWKTIAPHIDSMDGSDLFTASRLLAPFVFIAFLGALWGRGKRHDRLRPTRSHDGPKDG